MKELREQFYLNLVVEMFKNETEEHKAYAPTVITKKTREDLDFVFAKFSTNQQKIVKMAILGYKFQEIADEINCSKQRVNLIFTQVIREATKKFISLKKCNQMLASLIYKNNQAIV